MKAFLIDDERLARTELRRLLAKHPEIEIIGEAANVTDALSLIPAAAPDLLFLDISMPRRNGFDLLETLPPPHPRVIFTTAHDTFAIRAFEVNALDYLLKPINPVRLAAALGRLQLDDEKNKTPAVAKGGPVPASFGAEGRVFIKDGDRCWLVPLRSLRLIEAEGKHTRLHFDESKPLLFRSLTAMEERLPAELFLRANRNQIVNLNWIENIEPWFSGSLRVRLRGGEEIELSRRQSQTLRERLGL